MPKKLRSPRSIIVLLSIGFVLAILLLVVVFHSLVIEDLSFDPERAYSHVLAQVEFGPRIPGSEAHSAAVTYIQDQLITNGWQVELQETEMLGHPVKNIIAKRGDGNDWVILGAHYDSRLLADHDDVVENRSQPVPGANDGASGVAVLLELSRVIPKDIEKEIWLVFFDLEDQGRIESWDWILGSQAFVREMEGNPDSVVIIDMIGDADLNINREKSSSQLLTDEIWKIAADLGFEEYFIDFEKYAILDDHTPFLSAGINAIDIIDFDYPYWHTVNDTPDKVSPRSLGIVGEVLLTWLGQ